jgi:hypothetical protein
MTGKEGNLARVGYEGLQRLHLLVDLAPPPLHQSHRRLVT